MSLLDTPLVILTSRPLAPLLRTLEPQPRRRALWLVPSWGLVILVTLAMAALVLLRG